MKNWEVAKKRISEMNKDEFIDFIRSADRRAIHRFADLCDTEMCCREKECFKSGIRCIDCIIDLLEKEYQPPKQEKWIVHRTLRKLNEEVYIGTETIYNFEGGYLVAHNCAEDFGGCGENLYSYKNKKSAYKFNLPNALRVRDLLNKNRVGKQYLWVISRVEE